MLHSRRQFIGLLFRVSQFIAQPDRIGFLLGFPPLSSAARRVASKSPDRFSHHRGFPKLGYQGFQGVHVRAVPLFKNLHILPHRAGASLLGCQTSH